MPVLKIKELIFQMKKQADKLACPGNRRNQFERRVLFWCGVEWEAGRLPSSYLGHKQAAGVFMDIKFCQLITKD